MPPYLELLATLIGSNYPCLELTLMVPNVFEPLKFDCTMSSIVGIIFLPEKQCLSKTSNAEFHPLSIYIYICLFFFPNKHESNPML